MGECIWNGRNIYMYCDTLHGVRNLYGVGGRMQYRAMSIV